jgi:NitT/TauT family transport system substrate-binding protein
VLRVVALLTLVGVTATACGDDTSTADTVAPSESTAADAGTAETAPGTTEGAALSVDEVKLGFFPNVTHAPALVGVAVGTFADHLGDAKLSTFTFDAGTEAAEALLAGSLDLTFIGPNPAINAYAKSNGEAVRIVAGSTSGGAFLVVKPDITSPEQLAGKKIASPSLGNTQDVALRAWLKEQGFETTPEGGGDVTIIPQKNSTTLESFIAGDIDGAWVPEPWATRLIDEGGGAVLVDERDLWTDTGGEFVTTQLLVRTEFLNDHPDAVKAILEGLADAIDAIAADPAAAQADVVAQIGAITGKDPSADVIAKSFANLTFTLDPIAASLQKSADDAVAVGLLEPVDLKGIHDLTLLDEILAERGRPAVSGL